LRIIVCNLGSSSLKFQLLDMKSEHQIARGHIDRVGSENAAQSYWVEGRKVQSLESPLLNQRQAVESALDFLVRGEFAVISRLSEIQGVGFKCIQAGERNGSVLIDQKVLDAMEHYRELAPAHNPPYLEAIAMFRSLMPETSLVGVFEPGFHVDAPLYAKIYGTPYEWFEKFGVKKYGYHGASHRYVTAKTVQILGLPEGSHRIISCHLGGSSSLCAYKNGLAIDTSMGFTPQSGLIQGTRIGDLDPFVLPYIMKKKGISLEQALAECSKNAGLAGLSGTSGDMRDIITEIRAGSKKAELARDKFIYDVKRYIGEFLVLMEGIDAIAFTGGIGFHDADLRLRVLSPLHFLGLKLDQRENQMNAEIITTSESTIVALVLETDEEIVVARETVRVIQEGP
jgi:acetate kinase